jgi:hypothetical protein
MFLLNHFLPWSKKNCKEETHSDVLVMHCKWIPIPISDSSNQEVSPDLVVNVLVQYQQGEAETCLFCSLASAFHHLGQKHTGSMLASMAKKFCNFLAEEQLDKAIQIVKNHKRIYRKVDYWKKEAGIAKHNSLGQKPSKLSRITKGYTKR